MSSWVPSFADHVHSFEIDTGSVDTLYQVKICQKIKVFSYVSRCYMSFLCEYYHNIMYKYIVHVR